MTIGTEDIHGIVENVWLAMLGLGIELADADPAAAPAADAIVGSVAISGAWAGGVTVHCAPALAGEVAAIMFQTEPEGPAAASAAQVADAIAEIANMIGGNLKALLPEPCALTIPVAGAPSGMPTPAGVVVSDLGFSCLGHAFRVVVREEPAAALEASPGA